MEMVSDIVLYFAPGTCSRVPMISLDETGVHFESRLISHRANDHRAENYLRLNPTGKVPVLIANGRPLSENVAILYYLSRRFPEAGLLPERNDPIESAMAISDLSLCSSVLHPLVTRIRIPEKFCNQPDAARNVWDLAASEMAFHFQRIETRLSEAGPWWYGDKWSCVDAFLFWVWFRVNGAGFPTEAYPAFADHAIRMELRDSTRKTLAREEAAQSELQVRGLALEFKNTVL